MKALQIAADVARQTAITMREHAAAADRRADEIEAMMMAACDHQFDDWSNAHVHAPFDVCRHCGKVDGADMRMGRTVEEFREYMAKHAVRPIETEGARIGEMIAALFVETDGCYFGLDGVDPWDEQRDARRYAGPHPVVAHPPCQRWGRFWHGSTRKPHQYKLGDDKGCFKAALNALETFGGVIEHPADSHAWRCFGMSAPGRHSGWWHIAPPTTEAHLDAQPRNPHPRRTGEWWTCYVEQGHYGHTSRKPTWLLTQGLTLSQLPTLDWSRGAQRLHPTALARYGYEKARRIGMTAMVGGKDKTRIRNATPEPFRDVLLGIARLVATKMATV